MLRGQVFAFYDGNGKFGTPQPLKGPKERLEGLNIVIPYIAATPLSLCLQAGMYNSICDITS